MSSPRSSDMVDKQSLQEIWEAKYKYLFNSAKNKNL